MVRFSKGHYFWYQPTCILTVQAVLSGDDYPVHCDKMLLTWLFSIMQNDDPYEVVGDECLDLLGASPAFRLSPSRGCRLSIC
jgi:hypothetical protein